MQDLRNKNAKQSNARTRRTDTHFNRRKETGIQAAKAGKERPGKRQVFIWIYLSI